MQMLRVYSSYRVCSLAIVAGLLFFLSLQSVYALPIIRDAEIEAVLRDMVTPVLKVSSIDPESVHIIIVDSPEINAFVAKGSNIFVYTGLMAQFSDPHILLGVMAHEVGHITGGHLARQGDGLKGATAGSTLGYILGLAALLAGSPDAAIALTHGGAHIGQSLALQYSREQEQAADQSALRFLEKAGYTAKGLLSIQKYLNRKEMAFYGEIGPYAATHPLSSERIVHIQHHIEHAKHNEGSLPKDLQVRFERARTKLRAFLEAPELTLQTHASDQDTSVTLYARAIAFHRQGKLSEALTAIDVLLQKEPENFYVHELKGQILFEHGQLHDAVASYQKAFEGLSTTPLVELELAMAKIAYAEQLPSPKKVEALYSESLEHLQHVLVKEPFNVLAMRKMAEVYAKRGQQGESTLYQAKIAWVTNKKKEAKTLARKAQKLLPEGGPLAIQIQDILSETHSKEK